MGHYKKSFKRKALYIDIKKAENGENQVTKTFVHEGRVHRLPTQPPHTKGAHRVAQDRRRAEPNGCALLSRQTMRFRLSCQEQDCHCRPQREEAKPLESYLG